MAARKRSSISDASLTRRDSTISSTSLKSIEIEDEFMGKLSCDSPDASLNNNLDEAWLQDKMNGETMSLEEMVEAGKKAFEVLINNRYVEGYLMLDEHSNRSFFHAFGKCLILSLRFCFNMKSDYYKNAWDALVRALQLINRSRKVRSAASRATFMLFKNDYADWTDENCHAELCFAEISAFHAALLVANDRSITGFIKAAIKLRTCHNTYLECRSILKNRKQWSSQEIRDHFESGVLLGLGLFDLGVSFFPSKMIKLLEIAGFSGNRSAGLREILKCAQMTHTLRYPVVSLVLSGYYGFADFFYGLGEPDVSVIFSILDYWLPIAPKSLAVQMGLAFKSTWQGDFESACRYYDEYEKAQNYMKAIIYMSRWQKMWLYAIQSNWSAAVEQSRFLANNCKWSPSMLYYVHACLLSMFEEQLTAQNESERAKEMKIEMMNSFKNAIRLKRSFGGKRSFHEKLVAEKAKNFIENPDKIVLVPFDLMYLWNIFIIASRNSQYLPDMLSTIEDKLKVYTAEQNIEIHAYLTFMRGVCLEYSNNPHLAVETFYYVIDLEKQLKQETHLIPQSYFEIGQIYRRSNDLQQANQWYKKAKSFSNYVTDGLIKFRIDTALRCIKENASSTE